MSAFLEKDDVAGKGYDSRLMRRLLSYLGPYRRYLGLAILLLFLASLA